MAARRRRWQPLVANDRLTALVFGTVLSASIAHVPMRRAGGWIGAAAAAREARPIAAAAVARSMGLSHTTVRRHAADLVAAGLCIRSADGFRVNPAFFALPDAAEGAAGNVADLTAMLDVMALTYSPATAAVAAVRRLPPSITERLLLTFDLRVMETFIKLYSDFRSGMIVAAIVAANVRHITVDPVLASRFAAEETPPPDDQRVPIGLRALAREVDLPFETVRRRVASLAAQGVVAMRGDGVVVPTENLLSEPQLDNNRRVAAHFNGMLEALVALDRSKAR